MITSAYSPKLRRFGAIDEQTQKVIIPYEYSDVEIQPNGIVVTDENKNQGCFTLDGEIIFPCNFKTNISNIVFLSNSMYLFTVPVANCVGIGTFKRGQFILPFKYKSLLFFCGSNFQALEYSTQSDLATLLDDNMYYFSGASITPTKLCVQTQNDLWGILNLANNTYIAECNFQKALHYKDGTIYLYDGLNNKTRF